MLNTKETFACCKSFHIYSSNCSALNVNLKDTYIKESLENIVYYQNAMQNKVPVDQRLKENV